MSQRARVAAAAGKAPEAPGSKGPTYAEQLRADPGWALDEADRFFEGRSKVHETLRRITGRLNQLGIPYAVVGGMALNRHGYLRVTRDVDLLTTADGLRRIHQALRGRGYRPPFEASKQLVDTDTRVRVEFLVTGGYPGDGKPKPVAFPDPSDVAVELDGIKYIGLVPLIELKLASGISEPSRAQDIGDVQALIRELNLPRGLAEELSPYVQAKYLEQWQASRQRFVRRWRGPVPESMLRDGVTAEPCDEAGDVVWLVTWDPKIAARHELYPAEDVWEDGPAPE